MSNKYIRRINGTDNTAANVDVYAVLEAFGVHCSARQHAVKKLLCSGIRGKGDTLQDLTEAGKSIDRAIEMEKLRTGGRLERLREAARMSEFGR
jgi:hypothetical protein